MAENQISNVVPIGGRESSAVELSEDSSVMLTSCRERLVDGVTAVFIQHAGRANQEFMALADRAGNSEKQQVYFGAMHLLANRPQQLLQNFRNVYCANFDSTITNLCGGRSSRRKSKLPDELSLVDQDEFELDLALSKLTARAAFNCSQQLVALDRRLASMLKIQRIGQDDNPLHPGHLYRAILEALSGMDVERSMAFVILESFERQTAVELPGIYAGINRFLSKSGVLPTMSADSAQDLVKNPIDSGGGAGVGGVGYAGEASAGPGPASAGPAGYGAASTPAGPQGSAEDLFSQLLRALQSAVAMKPAGPGFLPGMPMMQSMPGAQMAGAPYRQPYSVNQLVEALGTVQRGPVEPGSMPEMGSVRLDPQGFDVLQQIRATPMANGANATDAMTIDIVSMLFDAIFNDPDLSSTMRAEIAKLQIPVLKVALLDKSFFTDRKHPARRLLDAIANSGIGRNDHDEPRLIAKITSIVAAVVKGFDSDIQIFSTQLQQLEAFLKEEEARAQDKSTEMVGELETRERKDVAPARATSEVEMRINRRNVPSLIADFLSRQWLLVLVDAFVSGGETGNDWVEALRLMDELIWSVSPKQGSQDRERLLALLPDMLKRLRTGLERVDLASDWDAFFGELIRLHMAALKDTQADPVPQAAQPAAKPAEEPEARPTPVAAPEVPTQAEHAPAKTASSESDLQLKLVQSLEIGAWVEFQSFRGTRNTLRLSWVSEFKRVYLFTNRQGENAMTLAATSFAEHLRKGTARLLSQNPLTDRAVAQVLEKVTPPSAERAEGSRPPGYAWE